MYKEFLIKNQNNFIVPYGFENVKVKSDGGQVYNIKIKDKLNWWSLVDYNGNFIRKAEYHEIDTELKKYPSILCAIIKNNIVMTKYGPFVMRCFNLDKIKPLTRIRARLLGKALVCHYIDYRDTDPCAAFTASSLLNRTDLTDELPSCVCYEQKEAYKILLENEKIRRIPPIELRIKNIMKRENADLISMNETKEGYSLSFYYKGTKRDIRIKEDLMLISSGMCLDGKDKDFSLESFLSILHHRGRKDWHDDGLYL